jgi:MFS family permease
MISLSAGPIYEALIQTASALPFFIFALPAGAIGDIVDRRKLILYTETWMLAVAIAVAVLTVIGWISPLLLLILTFALSAGDAFETAIRSFGRFPKDRGRNREEGESTRPFDPHGAILVAVVSMSQRDATSMTAHLGGIGSPAESLSLVLEALVTACPGHNDLNRHGVLITLSISDSASKLSRSRKIVTCASVRPSRL